MKRVKQLFTRLATMFLALICVVGMGTPVLAVDGNFTSKTKGNFTVKGFEESGNLSVNAYQIITVNVNDTAFQPEFPMYKWATESLQTWVTQYDINNRTDYIDGNGMVTENFKNISADDQTKFLEELAAAIKGNSISGVTSTAGTFTLGTAEFTNMSMGEYLITANGGVKIYSPTTVKLVPVYNAETKVWGLGDPEIGVSPENAIKSQAPSITKTVTSHKDQTVSIGDTVEYTLTVVIPDYPTGTSAGNPTETSGGEEVPLLKVTDTLGTHLKYDDAKIKVSVTLMGSDDSVSTDDITVDNTNNKNYSYTLLDENKKCEIEFANNFVLENGGKTIKITYSAEVLESATNGDGLKNSAVLTYSADPYTYEEETKTDSKNVYTYKTVISKYNSEGELLSGAEFKLTKQVVDGSATSEKDMYFKETAAPAGKSTTYSYTYDSSINEETRGYTTTLKVGVNGNLPISGLDEGTYTLTETKAPNDGYALPQGTITFVISNDETESGKNVAKLGSGTSVSTKSSDMLLYVDDSIQDDKGFSTNGDTLTIKVLNLKKDEANFTLPSTGGVGTLIFTVGGLFVMAGAVVLAVVMYKKRNA